MKDRRTACLRRAWARVFYFEAPEKGLGPVYSRIFYFEALPKGLPQKGLGPVFSIVKDLRRAWGPYILF